jgi:hypothetical protein
VKPSRPLSIWVHDFEWDARNEGHQEHGLDQFIADEVKEGVRLFFHNESGKSGSHKMIGQDEQGCFWTIIIDRTSVAGRWRPITGWPSTDGELSAYENGKRKISY